MVKPRVYFVDSGTNWGMGGWQISGYVLAALRRRAAEVKSFSLSAKVQMSRRAFELLAQHGDIPSFSADAVKVWASGPLLEDILAFEPDLVVVMKGHHVSLTALAALRKLGIPTALWTFDDPYELEANLEIAGGYDAVFTEEARCLEAYRASGGRGVFQLPLGCDQDLHRPAPSADPKYESDFCFVGAGYPNRIALLEALEPMLKSRRVRLFGDWSRLDRDSWLHGCVVPGFLSDAEVVKYYSGAKIVLNIHRDPAEPGYERLNPSGVSADGANCRVFEIAAAGAFQLVDSGRSDLSRHFDIGRELVRFDGPADLARNVEHFLAHDEERRAIAEAGRRRALRDHTYDRRVAELLERVQSLAAKAACQSGR
jgi:spore maturation protein CgeB